MWEVLHSRGVAGPPAGPANGGPIRPATPTIELGRAHSCGRGCADTVGRTDVANGGQDLAPEIGWIRCVGKSPFERATSGAHQRSSPTSGPNGPLASRRPPTESDPCPG